MRQRVMGLSDFVVRKDSHKVSHASYGQWSGAAFAWLVSLHRYSLNFASRQASARAVSAYAAALLSAVPDETIDADRVIDSLLINDSNHGKGLNVSGRLHPAK